MLYITTKWELIDAQLDVKKWTALFLQNDVISKEECKTVTRMLDIMFNARVKELEEKEG